MMTEETRKRLTMAAEFAANLCLYGGEDQAFYDGFWSGLLAHPDILREFVYYMEHGEFLCRKKVCGRSVVDVMVWQIDHFKAALDRGQEAMRCNKDRMVLHAFHTLLLMAENPEPYIRKMAGETGTDFEGKYS